MIKKILTLTLTLLITTSNFQGVVNAATINTLKNSENPEDPKEIYEMYYQNDVSNAETTTTKKYTTRVTYSIPVEAERPSGSTCRVYIKGESITYSADIHQDITAYYYVPVAPVTAGTGFDFNVYVETKVYYDNLTITNVPSYYYYTPACCSCGEDCYTCSCSYCGEDGPYYLDTEYYRNPKNYLSYNISTGLSTYNQASKYFYGLNGNFQPEVTSDGTKTTEISTFTIPARDDDVATAKSRAWTLAEVDLDSKLRKIINEKTYKPSLSVLFPDPNDTLSNGTPQGPVERYSGWTTTSDLDITEFEGDELLTEDGAGGWVQPYEMKPVEVTQEKVCNADQSICYDTELKIKENLFTGFDLKNGKIARFKLSDESKWKTCAKYLNEEDNPNDQWIYDINAHTEEEWADYVHKATTCVWNADQEQYTSCKINNNGKELVLSTDPSTHKKNGVQYYSCAHTEDDTIVDANDLVRDSAGNAKSHYVDKNGNPYTKQTITETKMYKYYTGGYYSYATHNRNMGWKEKRVAHSGSSLVLNNAYIDRKTGKVSYQTPSDPDAVINAGRKIFVPLNMKSGNFQIKINIGNLSVFSGSPFPTITFNDTINIPVVQKYYNEKEGGTSYGAGLGIFNGFNFLYRNVAMSTKLSANTYSTDPFPTGKIPANFVKWLYQNGGQTTDYNETPVNLSLKQTNNWKYFTNEHISSHQSKSNADYYADLSRGDIADYVEYNKNHNYLDASLDKYGKSSFINKDMSLRRKNGVTPSRPGEHPKDWKVDITR